MDRRFFGLGGFAAIVAGLVLLAHSLAAQSQETEQSDAVEEAQATAGPAGDDPAASIAAFMELAKVMAHPRCVNCHPRTDNPTQGEDMRPHTPPVKRGADGKGEGMKCMFCHRDTNNDSTGVPGAPDWHMAPIEMAWADLTAPELCAALTSAESNGGMTPAEIAAHMAEDEIVAWAWNPGMRPGRRAREVPPVDFETFKQAAHTWAATGAHCPTEVQSSPE